MPQFQTETRLDFSGGVDANSSPWVVSPKQVLRAQNLLFDQRGSMRTRGGYTVVDPNAAAGSTLRASNSYVIQGSGTTGLVVVQNPVNNGGANQLYKNNTNPWTLLGNLAQDYALARIVHYINVVVVTDSYTSPKVYNQTTASFGPITAGTGQTVPPGALWAIEHLNQLWLLNTAATRTALDGPTSVRVSDVASYTSWPNGNQFFLGSDADKGMGFGNFSIAEEGIAPFPVLVAFLGYSAYAITGTPGSGDFGIKQIRTDQGCAAGRSIQFCPGLGIVRLTQRGFYLYDGLNDQQISRSVEPYIFGGGGITGLDPTRLYLSVAALYPQPPLYVCVCPVSGILRRWFVLDLLTKVWTVFDLVSPTATGIAGLDLFQGLDSAVDIGQAVLRGGFEGDKNLYGFSAASLTDAGTAIPWSVRLVPVKQGSPLRRAFHRRMLATVHNVTQGQTVTASFAIGPAQQPTFVQSVAQSTLVAAPDSGAGTPAGALEVDLNFDIGRTGEVQYVELSGTGPITIRAVEWQGVPKPASRPVLT